MNKKSFDPIDEALARIYEAALDPAAWQSALERAANLIGAQRAMLFVADWTSGSYAPSILACHRMDPDLLSRWQASYLPHDLWSHRMRALPPNFVTTGASVVAPRDLARSVIYADVLRKMEIEDGLSTSLARGDGLEFPLSFYARDLFRRSQVILLERLTPHLRLAVRLHREMRALQHQATVMGEIVDRVSVGVLTLEQHGRIVWANRRAQEVLDRRDGLTLCNGRLRCTRADEMTRLQAAIEAASADVAATGRALSVSRRSGKRAFAVVVAPLLPRNEYHVVLGIPAPRAAVIVTVSDPEQRIEVLPERLCRIFGLTPAEARLAAALAMERSVREYAGEAAITINTARWTLKQVLAKTGCRRQSELVRLVLASAASVVA